MGLGFESSLKERIIFSRWCDVGTMPTSSFKKRLLVLTNAGIYIFKPSTSKPCSICPPENLCPDGPKLDIKFTYDDVIYYR
jgi:hypothetical protein